MKKATLTLTLALLFCSSLLAQNVPQYLQDISVTISASSEMGRSEGSGIIFSRKDKNGDTINFIWTAAHVIDHLKQTREVVSADGGRRAVIEFKDPKIVKEIKEGGRTIGKIEMDAEVIKFSNFESGHDLALLRLRKKNFISVSTKFYLDNKIPELGTDLLHVGSLLGSLGANSMTAGIYSQHGRLISSNKHVFDQTTVNAFPGSSGGGVFAKSDARYIGMLVRGAGETFNLIVPVRRMKEWAEKNKISWALDESVALPDEDVISKIAIEDNGKEFGSPAKELKKIIEGNKDFPFLIKSL